MGSRRSRGQRHRAAGRRKRGDEPPQEVRAPLHRRVFLIGACCLFLAACGSTSSPDRFASSPTTDGRVFFFFVGGVDWQDLTGEGAGKFHIALRDAAKANVSVRVSNRPADAYATLGAAERMQVAPSGGWAFGLTELVENGTGAQMYERRTSTDAEGAAVVVAIDQISRGNLGRAFNANPGNLGNLVQAKGWRSAAFGNADLSTRRLPDLLPDHRIMTSEEPPETGIHREVALSVMTSKGIVPYGDISRRNISPGRSGLPWTDMDVPSIVSGLPDDVRLIAIESGDTARVDAAGLEERARATAMRYAVSRAGEMLTDLLASVDRSRDLVILVSPTSPGGVSARGQLRPAAIWGPQTSKGLLMSRSTNEPGLVTLPDLTATAGRHLGVSDLRLGSGRATALSPEGDVQRLIRRNKKAVAHDRLRTPWAATVVSVMIAGLMLPTSSGWFRLVAATGLTAIPVSMLSAATWSFGPSTTAVVLILAALGLGYGLKTRPTAIVLITWLVLTLDVWTGARLQLDSLLGYTSVAAGRFSGLGNLGFAALAACAICGFAQMSGTSRGKALATFALVLTTITIAHPALGDDVGGTLAFVPAASVFTWSIWMGKRVNRRTVVLSIVAAAAVVTVFGLWDLRRPELERTHLGDLFATAVADPMGVVLLIRRKALLAATIGFTNFWGPLVLPAAYALLRRDDGVSRPRPTSETVAIVSVAFAASLGAALNDSGLAIAGLMAGILALWIRLVRESPLQPSAP